MTTTYDSPTPRIIVCSVAGGRASVAWISGSTAWPARASGGGRQRRLGRGAGRTHGCGAWHMTLHGGPAALSSGRPAGSCAPVQRCTASPRAGPTQRTPGSSPPQVEAATASTPRCRASPRADRGQRAAGGAARRSAKMLTAKGEGHASQGVEHTKNEVGSGQPLQRGGRRLGVAPRRHHAHYHRDAAVPAAHERTQERDPPAARGGKGGGGTGNGCAVGPSLAGGRAATEVRPGVPHGGGRPRRREGEGSGPSWRTAGAAFSACGTAQRAWPATWPARGAQGCPSPPNGHLRWEAGAAAGCSEGAKTSAQGGALLVADRLARAARLQ